jgi:hypothetical protein
VDEERAWERCRERLREEAVGRGGTAYLHDWAINLAPRLRGEHVHVTRSDDGYAKVETGFVTSTLASFLDLDDPHSVLSVVRAVMDGRAAEYADVSADGRWLDVHFRIDLLGGNGIGDARPDKPTAYSFERRLERWGGIRFEAG